MQASLEVMPALVCINDLETGSASSSDQIVEVNAECFSTLKDSGSAIAQPRKGSNHTWYSASLLGDTVINSNGW